MSGRWEKAEQSALPARPCEDRFRATVRDFPREPTGEPVRSLTVVGHEDNNGEQRAVGAEGKAEHDEIRCERVGALRLTHPTIFGTDS